jgi:dihydroorotase
MEEPENPDEFDIRRIKSLFGEYEKTLVGLKIRCNAECTAGFGTSPIKKAVEIADYLNDEGHKCRVTMHFGQVEDCVTVDDMADCLRAGDVFAHFYQPCKDQTFDEHGRMRKGIIRAKERGVLFDACMASSHYSFENIRIIMREGFMPDIISSDMVSRIAYYKPCFSLPYLLSLFLNEGMSLEEIFKAVTYTPAKAFGILGNAGTLKPGTRADVAIFKIKEQHMRVVDRFGGYSDIERLIVPMATVNNGMVVFQQLFFD